VYTFGFTHAYSIVRTKEKPCFPHKKGNQKSFQISDSVATVNRIASILWKHIETYNPKIAKSIRGTAKDKDKRKLLLGNKGESGNTPSKRGFL
jgi:hypothetical protein